VEGLKSLKGIAKRLKEDGYTVNISYEDKVILRLGKNARSGLLSLFGPIEVKDLKTVLKILGW
jgi:hypothetical protein